MDGHDAARPRVLTIDFQVDRHAPDRVRLAYQRVEAPQDTQQPERTSVQVALPTSLSSATSPLEVQG